MQNDKNTYIGLFLIGLIVFGYIYYSTPTKEQMARERARMDSIAKVEQKEKEVAKAAASNTSAQHNEQAAKNDSIAQTDTAKHINDSLAAIAKIKNEMGVLYPSLKGDNQSYTIENELLKATISTHGGRIEAVELKNFKTSAGGPLLLFTPDSSHFGLIINSNGKVTSTDSLYFSQVSQTTGKDSSTIVMRLNTGDPSKYLQYRYTVKPGSYLVGCKISMVGMQDVIASNMDDIELNWAMKAPSQEASIQNQQRTSTVYYKFYENDVDKLSPMKDENKTLSADVTWVSFKQQFFSSVIIAGTKFGNPSVNCATEKNGKDIKFYSADLTIPFEHQPKEAFDMNFYFGPNNYNLLKDYSSGNDWELQSQINLGWGIFGWVNKFIVIPIFDLLSRFNLNYGIVILILTIVIKSILSPIAYRTYVSSAKMRILKPEIDDISKKFPKTEDAMKKQQATMALYKKAGVNPMAGCLPSLLQLPILYALLNFFPASIELRQQKFLWANDLSTYDSIYNFHFHIPGYGDHISLFALLMTLSQYLYISANQQLMGTGGGTDQMAKTMKWMMYITPVFFLSFLNSYSAGLSYYYFLANLITFAQTFIARRFINETELHRKMQENKAKPIKVSRFQKRLQEMMKEQQAAKRR